MYHMLDPFCVQYVVIYLSIVELKGMMCDGDQENRGSGCWKWSGNGMEWNRTE